MQRKYIEHYTAVLFHKWFMNISQQVGESPFRATILNYLYTQDPEDPNKVRIQSFINGLVNFLEKVKDLPDPDPAPALVDVKLSEEVKAFEAELERKIKAAAEAKAKRDQQAKDLEAGLAKFLEIHGEKMHKDLQTELDRPLDLPEVK